MQFLAYLLAKFPKLLTEREGHSHFRPSPRLLHKCIRVHDWQAVIVVLESGAAVKVPCGTFDTEMDLLEYEEQMYHRLAQESGLKSSWARVFNVEELEELRVKSRLEMRLQLASYNLAEARQLIREQLQATEEEVAIHFIPSGTAANLIGIASCLRPYEAVLTVETGHIVSKEAGAIEATRHKTILVPGVRGKMMPKNLERVVRQNQFFPHSAKPRLVYISNATELGTLYTKSEMAALSATCRRLDLLLFIDGARIGVALSVATNDLTLRDLVDMKDIF